MPKLAQCRFFDGTEEKINRLGLKGTWKELEHILTGFEFGLEDCTDGDTAVALRNRFDDRFRSTRKWKKRRPQNIDWMKCLKVNGTEVCFGVKIQLSVSAQSDFLLVDLQYLYDEIIKGHIDVAVIVVPSNKLASFLADGVAQFADAVKAIDRARASDLLLAVLAIEDDGPALLKRLTPQGIEVAR
jgi:hypothetical protein